MRAKGWLGRLAWWLLSLLVMAVLLLPALHHGMARQAFEPALLAVALILWGTAVYAISTRGHETLVQRLFWLHMTTAVILAYGNPTPDEVSWDRPIEVAGMALLPAVFYRFFHRLAARGEGGGALARSLWLGGAASGVLLLATQSSRPVLNNVAHVLLYAFLLVGFGGGIIELLHSYIHPRSAHQRRQLQAVLIGVSVAVLPLIGFYLLPGVLGREPVLPPQLAALSLVFLPISLIYAVLRHHLFDIDAAVHRGVLYTITTLVLAGCYALFLYAVGLLGLQRNSPSAVPALIFFAAVAATFVPLQTWIRKGLDRAIYRDRYDYARTLRDLGAQLASIRPLDEMLTMVAQRVTEAMNLTGAAILLRQGEGGFTVGGASGIYTRLSAEALVESALRGQDGTPAERRIPLMAHGEVCGLLCLGPKRVPSALRHGDLSLIETLASQTAVAVENALLVDRLREKVQELELLRDQLLHVQEEERKRVAQMIHDDVLAVQLQMLSRIEGAMASLNGDSEPALYLRQGIELGEYGAHRLREACTELYPTELKHYGLRPALATLADDVSRSEDFEVVFSSTHFPDGHRLPKEVEDALYRTARQALDNVRRHARARLVRMQLSIERGCALLTVSDDGRGFDVLPSPATLLRQGHLGLVTIRETIEALDGVFHIESAPSQGTEIRVAIPVAESPVEGAQDMAAGIAG